MHILAKIKIHIWRLFDNFLSHFCNLTRRNLSVEIVSPLCKKDPEDADHLMWSCGIIQRIWASLNITILSIEALTCCKNRFANTFSAAEEQQKHFITLSIWGLWYRRNKLLHEGVKFSLQELLGFIRGYDQDLRLNQVNLSPSCSSMAKELWRPSDAGVIKLNFDAAFQSEARLAIIVVLARDSEGEVLARDSEGEIVGAETYLFEDVVDAFVAEARVCKRALLLAGAMGFRRLIVEGDSLFVP